MRKAAIILVFSVCSTFGLAQHNALVSDLSFEPFILNPAAAGHEGFLSVSLGYRGQWTGFEGSPRTDQLLMHSPLLNKSMNLGLQVRAERLGIFKLQQFSLSYAWRKFMGKNSLSFGLSAGLLSGRCNWSELVLNQQGDNAFVLEDGKVLSPDASFGVEFRTPGLVAGISLPRLFIVRELGREGRRPISLLGAWKKRWGNVIFEPSFSMNYIQGSPVQLHLQLGAGVGKLIWGSVGYRTKDAVILTGRIQVNDQLLIGYSRDLNFSALRSYHSGTNEIMMRYRFGYAVKNMDPSRPQ